MNIGIDKTLENHPQIVLLEGMYEIDDELKLFTVNKGGKCYSSANDILYSGKDKDKFEDEQSLIIKGNTLVMGCGHKGIVNILNAVSSYDITTCVGGYHLYKPISKTVSEKLLDEIAAEISKYDITYYTCHCTGEVAYNYLTSKVKKMYYLSTGEKLEL